MKRTTITLDPSDVRRFLADWRNGMTETSHQYPGLVALEAALVAELHAQKGTSRNLTLAVGLAGADDGHMATIARAEAARRIGVTPKTIRQWINAGRLDVVPIGAGRILVADIDALLVARQETP